MANFDRHIDQKIKNVACTFEKSNTERKSYKNSLPHLIIYYIVDVGLTANNMYFEICGVNFLRIDCTLHLI